jgi:GATA zinc finger
VQTGTPLWRNGPPDKPVLCNACGSRWRTKGTLLNYTPTRTREFEEVVKPKSKLPIKIKNVSFKNNKGKKTLLSEELSSHESSRMVLEGDVSSWSCSGSGSAISSESCVVTRTNDLTGEL